MNLIKRISTSVTASLDSAVGQIENHDAIVDASVKKTRQAVAKSRARINTLQQQERSYHEQLQKAQDQFQIWTDRAIQLADRDKEKALQCVSRRNQCEREVNRLSQSLEQQQALIREVDNNLQKLRFKLDEMTQKHNLMRSRQTVADVNRAVAFANLDESLNDTFERWEASVLECELVMGEANSRDFLDVELSRQEDEEQLLAQLAELTNAETSSEHNSENGQ